MKTKTLEDNLAIMNKDKEIREHQAWKRLESWVDGEVTGERKDKHRERKIGKEELAGVNIRDIAMSKIGRPPWYT